MSLKPSLFTPPPFGSRLNVAHPLSRGLVGRWLMNEGGGSALYDLVSSNRLSLVGLTWASGGSALTGVFGPPGTAEIYGKVSAVDLSRTNAISVSLWYRPITYTTSSFLFSAGSPFYYDVTDGWAVWTYQSNRPGEIMMELKGDVGANRAYYSSPLINTWHHCVAIFDKGQTTQECRLFMDGAALSTTLVQGLNNTNAFGVRDVYLMGRSGGGNVSTRGYMFDFQIFSRVLSPAEILSMYASPFQNIIRPGSRC